MITFLTILNTLAIAIVFYKLEVIKITFRKDETFWQKTLTGVYVYINQYGFRIPLRNKRKIELRDEIQQMISAYSQQNKLQTLSAKFSWLRTSDEVRQFEKDYSIVDRKIVERLVANFEPKQ